MTDKIVVLVTCGSKADAARIAQALVDARLAACVNIVEAPVRSVYRWKGKVETARVGAEEESRFSERGSSWDDG